MGLFSKKKTPAELLRENKRALDKAIRELDRERVGLQNQEKKIVAEIRKLAKDGQMASVKVLAKSLVRNRHAVTKMYGLKSQLQAVSMRLATLKSTQAMAQAMMGATRAMKAMSKQLNLPNLQNVMREFERQNEKMEMTSDMMGDAVDDALGDEDEEEESDALVNQVLDEIGIGLGEQIGHAPTVKMQAAQSDIAPQKQAQAMGAGQAAGAGEQDPGLDDDLQARLDNLRK